MPYNLLLWGYVKDSVVPATLPKDLLQLCGRMIAVISEIVRDMLQRMWAEMDYRLDVCLVTKGRPVEDLWGMRKKKKSWRFSVFVCRSHVTILPAIPGVPTLWPWQKYQIWLRFYQTISNLSLYQRGSYRRDARFFKSLLTYIKKFRCLLKFLLYSNSFYALEFYFHIIIRNIFYS